MALTHDFDLAALRLSAGEGRQLDLLEAALDDLQFGGQRYRPDPRRVAVVLDVSRLTREGFALRLRFETALVGPCMRCLDGAEVRVKVDAREVDQPNGGEELDSPYVQAQILDIDGWARDALVLALPTQIVCRADCAGLCPVCGADLNRVPSDHHHERPRDPRLAKLSEVRFS